MTTKPTLRVCTLSILATLSLAASAMAGPGMMVMMFHGKMVMVTPMDHDITYENGTKVMMNGTVMMKDKKMHLREGQAITAEGLMMKALATEAHGG